VTVCNLDLWLRYDIFNTVFRIPLRPFSDCLVCRFFFGNRPIAHASLTVNILITGNVCTWFSGLLRSVMVGSQAVAADWWIALRILVPELHLMIRAPLVPPIRRVPRRGNPTGWRHHRSPVTSRRHCATATDTQTWHAIVTSLVTWHGHLQLTARLVSYLACL